jgi:site-specific DNA-methyltransferase (adenine-specific)
MFFIIHKGRPVLNKPGRSNVFTFKPVPPQKKTHPTERPIELMMELFQTFSAPGNRYLIPCLGSGTSLLAGHQCSMTGFGYDLAEEFKKDFIVRVQENL